MNSTLQSGRNGQAAAQLQNALIRDMRLAPTQVTGQINNFFATTNLTRLSVNNTGQQIPLNQFMGQQVVSQLSNTLGSLAASLPSVATSMLFPNGVTATPSQDLINGFNSQVTNALDTAAFQLGSSLAMLNGSSSVVSQLEPLLFGSTTNPNSLASVLQSLPLGTASSSGITGASNTSLSSAVESALNTGMNNLVAPLASFLSVQEPANLTLPTADFTSPFSSAVSTGLLNSQFNNGFSTGTTSGFVGLGIAPALFNTNFGTGFNGLVNSAASTLGLGSSLLSATAADTTLSPTGLGTTVGSMESGTVAGSTGVGTGVGVTGINLGTRIDGYQHGTGIDDRYPAGVGRNGYGCRINRNGYARGIDRNGYAPGIDGNRYRRGLDPTHRRHLDYNRRSASPLIERSALNCNLIDVTPAASPARDEAGFSFH